MIKIRFNKGNTTESYYIEGRIVDINNNWGKCFIVEDLNSKNNVIGSLWKHNRYEFACGNIKKIEGNKIYIKENC